MMHHIMQCTLIIGSSFLVACSWNQKKVEDPMLVSMRVLNEELKQKYNRDLAVLIGRMDGMNQAIVQGLNDQASSMNEMVEMSKAAKGLSETNDRKIARLEKQISILMNLLRDMDADMSEIESSSDPDMEALFE